MASTTLSLRDNMLLEAAANGLSGEEMEVRYGIPAAEAVVRVREILRARDIWSEIEQKQLLLVDLQKLKSQLASNMSRFEEDPAWASVMLRTLKQIGDILDKQSRITDADLNTVTEAHAKALLNLVVRAFGAAKTALERDYPMVDVQEIEEVFNVGLLEASRQTT